ncbi:MAG: sulfite exporter TauE/SafE family protein [Gemmatimonadota bacterium]|nr:sulfite exporter TauE/SafE family protein [Gemmatimonadota bacterium]MDE3005706.1 sulfite exporter TauE/SafE family protein [Gemmatimonadota bacterium]
MPFDFLTTVSLIGAGFLAGTINSIAGGGSLLTLPLLIFTGLPATVANGTNRIAIFAGGIGATTSFHRRKLIPFAWVKFALPPALIGVALGTWGANTIGDVAFERILAGILVLTAVWMVWHPVTPPDFAELSAPDPEKRWLLMGAFFLLGVYSGFIQAGVGFLFLALLSAQGLDLVRGNAVKVPLILAFTALAIPLFALGNNLDWIAGLSLASGQFFGAKLGVRLQVLKGQAWVRNVLTVAVLVFAIQLVFG